jgi:hypothetical protein
MARAESARASGEAQQRAQASVVEPWNNGAVAQLGEHLVCNQGVTGSIPVSSTKISAV